MELAERLACRTPVLLLALASLLAGATLACASAGRGPACRIEVTALERHHSVPGDLEIEYRVRGEAGAAGKVWLAARTAERTWVSGGALEVGPGEFSALVDLRLTGRPESYSVVLEVAGRRCSDDAPMPGR